jgi:hypothetical protein
MYFAGQELNEPDRILQSLSSEEQARVVVDFAPEAEDAEILAGKFDVVLPRA